MFHVKQLRHLKGLLCPFFILNPLFKKTDLTLSKTNFLK
ncbi:hypothetical protein TPE_0781 [Treponema pedis str. T A4]|uniref:Uncharacterized protein n=1 Tax=Treponema pedis str. T A4 TaxID=1291379 RepID=S5ZL30_9SPIR|nr:hypothetical protein TPE_0781 [Treponema pedis str. T A4]